jgi:surface polysaccharide O-acyltransferase-like enzyme
MKTHYPAVFACAFGYWLLGAVWYGALFSQRWMALEQITEAQARGIHALGPYMIAFLLDLLIAFALAQLCSWRNANTAARGSAVGVLLWIGIVAPVTFTTHLFELKPIELYAINEVYPLVGLALMGAVLGAWKKKPA